MLRILSFWPENSAARAAGRILPAVLLGLALAGCGGSHGNARLNREEYPVKAPQFLAGPAGLLLTNSEGFSARVTLLVAGASNKTHNVTGTLLGHGTMLLYAPEKSDRTFLWDVNRNSGFLLSEALQGYGPIRQAESVATNFMVNPAEGIAERANGHDCHKADWIAESTDGSRTRCSVWRAADLKGFPVRIKAVDRTTEFTVDFSEVRLAATPEKLFSPPGDFTAYSSADAMVTELMMRQTYAKAKPTDKTPAETPQGMKGPTPINGRY